MKKEKEALVHQSDFETYYLQKFSPKIAEDPCSVQI